MGRLEWLEQLRRYDEEGYLEYPSRLLFGILAEKIPQVAESLKTQSGLDFCIDVAQDATFYADVFFCHNRNDGITVRFSNFGMLATLIITNRQYNFLNETVYKTLQGFGFTYIPMDVLLEPYSGKNDSNVFTTYPSGTPVTWLDRYFDYL